MTFASRAAATVEPGGLGAGGTSGSTMLWGSDPLASKTSAPHSPLCPLACGEKVPRRTDEGGSCKLSHPHPAFRATFSPLWRGRGENGGSNKSGPYLEHARRIAAQISA